jgi:hypothetical protein
MGHFAQYRHRGGGTTGFAFGPPASAAWTPSISTSHVRVDAAAGPGGVATSAQFITYLTSTPNTINESVNVGFGTFAIGSFNYVATNVVGIRFRFVDAAGNGVSPWSSEKTLTF